MQLATVLKVGKTVRCWGIGIDATPTSKSGFHQSERIRFRRQTRPMIHRRRIFPSSFALISEASATSLSHNLPPAPSTKASLLARTHFTMTASSSFSSAAPSCHIDRDILHAATLHKMDDIALSFFASACGKNRGAFVLDPPDGQTYGWCVPDRCLKRKTTRTVPLSTCLSSSLVMPQSVSASFHCTCPYS